MARNLQNIITNPLYEKLTMSKKGRYIILRDRTGFTLMEILITVTVIGIVAVLTAPALMSLSPSMELKGAAGDLYATIQQAKVLAIRTNKTVNIQFTAAGYTFFEPFTDTNGDGTYTAAAPAEVYNDMNGNGAHDAVKAVTYATEYENGIRQGFQVVTNNNAGNDWNGAACSLTTNIAFNSRGLATINPLAAGSSAYLDYLTPGGTLSPVCYAVEVRVAGSIATHKFNGSTW